MNKKYKAIALLLIGLSTLFNLVAGIVSLLACNLCRGIVFLTGSVIFTLFFTTILLANKIDSSVEQIRKALREPNGQ